MNDKAMEYQACLYKVEKALKELSHIGLNVSKYQEQVNKIVESNKNEVNNSYNFDNEQGFSFATSVLENTYQDGIKKLNLIYQDLKKYEIYLKVVSFSKTLKEFLEKKDKVEIDIINMRTAIKAILENLKKSSTLDYDVEKDIIEDIYDLTLEFIKEETKFMGSSQLLFELKKDDIHSSYMNRAIEKELETLNLKDPKYERLKARKEELIGFDSNFLDEDFIRLLSFSTLSFDYYKNLLDYLDTTTQKYLSELERNKRAKKHAEENINNSRDNIKHHSKYLAKYISMFGLSSALVAGLITGTIKLSKWVSKNCNDEYKILTSYSLGESLKIESVRDKEFKNGLYLYENMPFEEQDDSYKREIVVYDISNLDLDSIQIFLEQIYSGEIDLSTLNRIDTFVEEQEALSPKDNYEDTNFIIKNIETDIKTASDESIGWTFSFSLLAIVIYAFYECIIPAIIRRNKDYNYNSSFRAISFLIYGSSLLEQAKKLRKTNRNKKEANKELKRLEREAILLIKENEDIVNRALKMLPYIKENEELKEKCEELTITLKRIDDRKKQ